MIPHSQATSGTGLRNSMNLFRLRTILCLFAVFLAMGLVVQHAGLHTAMYYDSAGNIAEKRNIFAGEGLRGVLHLFPQRPLPTATFYLNFLIGDVTPFSFRIFNLALLAGSSILVVLLVRLFLDLPAVRSQASNAVKTVVSIFAGLVFLLHPLQTYLTLYIWQRMALMACFFSYACLAMYLAVRSGRWSHPRAGYALCGVLFACAILSKENSITLPCILILAEIAFFLQPWTQLAKRAGIVGLIALGFLAAVSFLQHPHGNAQLGSGILATISRYYAESGLTLKQVVFTQSRMLFLYLSLILVPLPSRVQLINPQVLSLSLMDPPVTIAAVAGAIALLVAGISCVRKRPLWGFGILFFLVNLVPEALLVPQYAYFGYRPVLPMFGVLLILADCLATLLHAAGENERWRVVRAGVFALLAGGLIFLGTSTALRADVWSDPLRFWRETVDEFPGDGVRMEPKVASHALGNLGAAFYASGRYAEAADSYERAISLSPEDPRKMLSLAASYAELGSLGEAEALLKRAMAISPDFAPTYKNLGIVYMKQNKLDQALEILRKGLTHTRYDESFYETIGQVQLRKRDVASAVASFGRAIALNPHSASLRFQLGQALLAEGNPQSAADSFRKAVELKPDYWEAHNSLGITYANQGKLSEALAQFRRALAIDPGNAQLRSNVETAAKQIQSPSHKPRSTRSP